ncbi:hypothetical protein IW262DRAFT_1457710 [Armillaria fumosa]|nr:hypothetical protein IW262DRAFT_1457710 [Armillaria fumosa]
MDYNKPWPESQGVRMAHLALYILVKVEETGVWNVWSASINRQPSLNTSAKFNVIIPALLSCTIRESLERFHCWGMTQVFWNKFSSCHQDALSLALQLYNSNSEDTVSENLIDTFFATHEDSTLNFSSITQMADEVSTHLCVPFMNPGETRSRTETPATIPEDADAAATKLLAEYDLSDPWGRRRQEVLKSLVHLRDGGKCPLSDNPFKGFGTSEFLLRAPPTLCHIIPNSIGYNNKTGTLNMICLFAGKTVGEHVREKLNSLVNVINLDTTISVIFDTLAFGIEALTEDNEVHYIFRLAPKVEMETGTNLFAIKPNARLPFGTGPDGEKLGGGPDPVLCNLHWAVVRVMRMSGAADVLQEELEEQQQNPSAISSRHYIDARLDHFAMERETVSSASKSSLNVLQEPYRHFSFM